MLPPQESGKKPGIEMVDHIQQVEEVTCA